MIALHFYPGTGAGLRETTGLDAVADRENFLVAYPDGQNGGFNALICCGTRDDVGFLRSLTAHLVRTWRADPDRIYLTGISNGGDMSFRAAVEIDGVFAAIGVVSGGYSGPRTAPEDYVPEHPVSVITFIGGQDRYADVFTEGVRTWQRRLGCKPASGAPQAGAAGVTRTDARCADGSDVTVHTLPDMGHSWPGARGAGRPTRRPRRWPRRHRADLGLLRRPPAPDLTTAPPAGGRAAGQRRSSIRVLPSVFGLTRSRSRNSATPSS
ncbi:MULTISPECIES: PHB depolymerase family esterase [unclassified Micromonospora]|uniref:alpha/beta hydrolase family esterase n=1 Tax=unclassified Micromonospora TaxID=2617518 RepID=UPI00332A9481